MTKHDSKTADELILENAPEGATHHSQGMHYLSLNSSNNWMRYDPNGFKNAKWFKADDYLLAYCNKSFRSLADITELVELRKKNAELVKYKNRVDEIIQSFGIQSCINDEVDLKKAVAIFKLEQQATGIDLALSDYPCMYGDTKVYVADLENRAKKLREQAKQLKGGAK